MGMVMNPEIAGVIGFDLKDKETPNAPRPLDRIHGRPNPKDRREDQDYEDWMSYE